MPSQDLTLTLAYSDADNQAPVFSERSPATAKWGLSDEGDALGQSVCSAQLDNRTGVYNPGDARSSLFGQIGTNTPATVSVGPEVLADGSVSSWSPDREIKGPAWTDVEITGPSRRVNASKAVRSALRRSIERAPNLLAYWPLEDPSGTVLPSAARPGSATPRVQGTAEFGNTSIVGGSASLVDLMTSSSTLIFPLSGLGLTNQEVHVELAYGAATDQATDFILAIGTSSFGITWNQVASGAQGDGRLHLLSFNAVLNGANVDYTVYRDSTIQSFSIPGDIGYPQEIRIGVVPSGSAPPQQWMLGHLAVYSAFSDPTDRIAAAAGYAGETCNDRFTRLCGEHNIPCNVADDGHASPTMGVQRPDNLANLLKEVRNTDGGFMYDSRGWNELEFRPRSTMWNQVPALMLTFNDNVAAPIRPATDVLGTTNDVTAVPRDGLAYHVSRESGPNNASDPEEDPEGIGREESRIDCQPYDLARLADIAGWALHLGTWPGARYRQVTVDLAANPDLIPDVMALRPGDVITIDALDADQVELMVLGGVDTVGSITRRIVLNCTDAAAWRVGVVGFTDSKRVGHANSWLASSFTTGGTSMSVGSSGALWSTTASPFNIRVGGVVLHVTAVAGASSPQTFTVDATPVNGVSRTIAGGTSATALTRIDLEHPNYVG